MHIRKKRIHNVEGYISPIGDGTDFRVSLALPDGSEKELKKAGFTLPVSNGDTVLPPDRGPISRFNADGKWNILRDQGLEKRFVRTIRWRWKQWSGKDQFEEMEDDRDIYRDCYPRDFVEPPSIELTYVEEKGRRMIVSPAFKKIPQNYDRIRHVINLFLELFGECELVTESLMPFVPSVVRKVNWQMLPPGRYPWSHIESHLKTVLSRASSDVQTIILDRQKTITEFIPDETFVGLGGFSDYVAYKFNKYGIVVLESIRKDNAIYVFGKNWQDFSRLTKAEVLSNNFHRDRIVHIKGWKTKLAKLFPRPAAV
jgi:hypothetical protein